MRKPDSSHVRSVPWLWITVGIAAVWAVFLLVMGFDALMQSRSPQHAKGRQFAIQAVDDGPVVVPAAKQKAEPDANNQQELPLENFNDVQDKKKADEKIFADCGQIGTKVLFVRDPPEAFKRAHAEGKIVYMMHLSGNLEDKDFT
jgi:hypothetical protein